MLGTELFVGRRSLRFNALPISIVSIPANTNLIPANNICVHVSLDGISTDLTQRQATGVPLTEF